ncbi:uncharacterized protein KIAA1614 homolog [Leptonychotes weddellii]|uniref:Uncharacterized protein KIAA1614 homolog n=1 Tax=Leptonychotes weddellii TaxID=9713 RepID=A0A7F8R332_LEPWE|nr:uncharacterized protein KIAA1614 homolog [Leptonychotes weddellii]
MVFFYLWIVFCIISSCYTLIWDLKMDWGLFDKNAGENTFLREEIVYPQKAYYYCAIIEDVILRFAWTVQISITSMTLSPHSGDIVATVFAPLEVFRRFVWNFFRLENEHLNNCGEFRAVRDISVAPLNADDQTLLEQMMDQDDGVRNRQKNRPWKYSQSISLRRPRLASQGTQIGSRTTSTMEMTLAVERSGSEPQLDSGHLPRPCSCSLEDRTPSLMVPQDPRAWGLQLPGPSVLESKVRALKEKMTAGKQVVSPGLTSHERPSKKPKCRRVKVGGAGPLSEGSSLPDAEGVIPAQNLPDGQLDSDISKEEPARNGGPRPPRPPSPGLECWNGRSPRPPEAIQALPDNERSLLPGPGSLQENTVHRVTPGRPGGPGPCNKIAHMPNLRKGRSYALQDDLVTGGDLDSLSLTCEEDFVPRPALLGGLWRAAELGALGTGDSALSLSDRVERNRLLLQEMLNVGGQEPPRVGIPAWTPPWHRGLPERPAGDVDWDSGISLQDSDQNRTFGPKPESVLSPRPEEAKHLLQRARMKARTRPLRASHEIVPAVAQGSREASVPQSHTAELALLGGPDSELRAHATVGPPQSGTSVLLRKPLLWSPGWVSPSHQHRKAASFQNLHSLLSGKGDRSSLYMVGEPGDHSAVGRPTKASPRRALSVEDVSAPSQARTVGRVVEVFPDGTTQLQLQRSPEGSFGFCVASGNGRRDSGFYVQEMADASMAKLYSGLLGVGDEILEVNGAKVAGLGLAHIKELLAHAESLSVRVLRQRPVPQ